MSRTGRTEYYLVSDDNLLNQKKKKRHTSLIIGTAVLEERLYVEPATLTSSQVESHPHGVALLQTSQSLVDGNKLVALDVTKLRK